jgi:hypothetical protein
VLFGGKISYTRKKNKTSKVSRADLAKLKAELLGANMIAPFRTAE